MKRFLLLLAALATVLLLHRQASASHFRYGTIHWSLRDPQGAPTTVTFRVSYGILSSSPPNLRTVTLDFGDGADSGALAGPVVGKFSDPAGQSFDVRELVVKHTYAAAGTYTAFFDACCRIASLVNGANQTYHVSSVVSLQPGNSAGPVSASLPVVELQLGAPRTYVWPVLDPDGDPITCRFGTDAETGFADAVPVVPPSGPGTGGQAPALASYADHCQLGWDLADAKAGQRYTIHLVFESSHGGGISSTALDFVVEIVTGPPPTCAGGGGFVSDVGQAVATLVTGTHNLPTDLTAAVIGGPGATLAPGGGGPSPFETTFAWTPDPASGGTTRTFQITFTNDKDLSGACYVAVTVPGCSGAGTPCSAGIGECYADGEVVCIGGGETACGAQASAPTAEVCDGKDNDCNGAADDGDPVGSVPCSTGLPGICDEGTTLCAGGALTCVPGAVPGEQPEVCDGEDDDCDGETDEGFALGEACSAGLGQCAAFGELACDADGGVVCDATPGAPAPEICADSLDQDCDGVADNGCGGGGGDGGTGGSGGGSGGGLGGNGGGTGVAPCSEDADCGGPQSGKICDASKGICIDGCRATGNGCPAGLVCSSTTGIGVCEEDEAPSAGCGILCASRPRTGGDGAGWLVILASGGLAVARRRSRRRAADLERAT